MTHFVIFRADNGLVTLSGYEPRRIDQVAIPPGHYLLITNGPVDHKTSRVVDGAVVTIPPKPSIYHEWVGEGWVDARELGELKAEKSRQIDLERERRNLLPLEYEGHLFDADQTAQRNISAWMTVIAAGQQPPEGFAWRGYDNVDHPADGAFIVGLGAAITLRGTLLYQAAWAKKAALNALATPEEVAAFDVTTGW